MKSAIFSLMLLSFSLNAFSQDTKKKTPLLKLLIAAGLELGGDKIAEVYFTNGEKQSVRAGQGGAVGIGGEFSIPGATAFALRSTVGIKYVTTAADDRHIRLTRIPIIVTANYRPNNKWRLAAGLSTHRNIQFKTDGLGSDYKLQPASGPVFEVAYAGVGLSFTGMKYKDQLNQTYNANAFGLSYSMTIPAR